MKSFYNLQIHTKY